MKLEAFWRARQKAWRDSNLNQREYCELHGLPLKRFGNCRADLKSEETIVPEGLPYLRGGGDQPRLNPRRREIHPPPVRWRRNYSDANKRRLIEEATRENALVSGVARKYGISTDVMFRWRRKLGKGTMHRIVPITITDTPDGLADLSVMTMRPIATPSSASVEQAAPAIEIELAGGRRLRFSRNTHPFDLALVLAGAVQTDRCAGNVIADC